MSHRSSSIYVGIRRSVSRNRPRTSKTGFARGLGAALCVLVATATVSPAQSTSIGQQVSAQRGARIFAGACAACHGRDGRGDGPGAADLDPAPRDLTTNRFRFRTSPSGGMPNPEDLERTIRDGMPGSSMPAFGALFSAAEIVDVVGFIYSLQPSTDHPSLDVVPIDPVTPASEMSIRQGQALYLIAGCASCHGLEGSGRGNAAAGLTDGGGRPIRATNFLYDPLKRGRDPAAIVATLRTGLNGAPMPSYDEAMLFARETLEGVFDTIDPSGKDRTYLDEFIRSAPTRADLELLGESGRGELRDHRMAALAHYVLSLSRRNRFGYRFLRQEPELEPRTAPRRPAESSTVEDPWRQDP